MNTLSPANDPRAAALSAAIRIEIVTVAWMTIEGAASIFAGVVAHSTSLIAFGADSIIELIAGAILLWRLQRERGGGLSDAVDKAERIAAWVTASALVALCLYIVVASGYALLNRGAQETSWIGIAISIAALCIMPPLAAQKRRLARVLNSAALRADAACSVTCAFMAGALLAGLVINALTGWWWCDSAASLAFLFWLIPETREAIQGARHGELRCDCD